ncbi:hypothetical protein ABTD83_21230, partial [Acinetobacter baumannii]
MKTAFFCSNCGYESAKWIGKCPACSQWNTFTEEILDKGNVKEEKWDDYKEEKRKTKTISLNEVQTTEEKRIKSQDPELDR